MLRRAGDRLGVDARGVLGELGSQRQHGCVRSGKPVWLLPIATECLLPAIHSTLRL